MVIKYDTDYIKRIEKETRIVINTQTNDKTADGDFMLDEDFNSIYLDFPQWEEYIKKAYDEKITLPFD